MWRKPRRRRRQSPDRSETQQYVHVFEVLFVSRTGMGFQSLQSSFQTTSSKNSVAPRNYFHLRSFAQRPISRVADCRQTRSCASRSRRRCSPRDCAQDGPILHPVVVEVRDGALILSSLAVGNCTGYSIRLPSLQLPTRPPHPHAQNAGVPKCRPRATPPTLLCTAEVDAISRRGTSSLWELAHHPNPDLSSRTAVTPALCQNGNKTHHLKKTSSPKLRGCSMSLRRRPERIRFLRFGFFISSARPGRRLALLSRQWLGS